VFPWYMFHPWAPAVSLTIGAARHVVASNTLRMIRRTAVPKSLIFFSF
jgi:hypothetical protein